MMISNVSVLVANYDRDIDFYVNKLGFKLLCDVPVTSEQRWIRVAPQHNASTSALVLTLANQQQQHLIGKQAGEGVFLFLQSEDFWTDYQGMQTAGVEFLEQPREEIYATVVMFRDGEGNKWDLLQPKNN
ncbi:VOC family protein [Paraglaciecola hydrolytica]|uniref:Glyoxalase n=1 Tax=Paraglaciecola hydrolytica TaxID=1799789 RepID=A0A148KKG6_9ALTE|nr:VOC family protein [Paraglaciecola hydrolytica]KXI26812.1 glyoxalase [Paraglaciecola hydrolytica]